MKSLLTLFGGIYVMPDLEQKTFQKRQVAYKVKIADLLRGNFIKDDVSAGHLNLGNLNVSRINIIAAIVYKPNQEKNISCIIDDGTDKMLLRSFENSDIFSKVDVGDIVLVVGKIREYNNERYIIPEIIKKLDNQIWMTLRKLEFKDYNIDKKPEIKNKNSIIEEILPSEFNMVYSLIKNHDQGEGAIIDDVIQNSKNKNTEEIINKLLENGDIFEIKPGRLKVLE